MRSLIVTSKNVSWPRLIWPTLYNNVPIPGADMLAVPCTADFLVDSASFTSVLNTSQHIYHIL